MMKACHALTASPNLAPANCSDDFSWRKLFKALFPVSTAPCAASFMRTNVRAAEHVMSGRNGPSARALINLLRSSVGPQVLDAIVGEVDWRANERRLLRIADLENQLEEQKRRLASLSAQLPR